MTFRHVLAAACSSLLMGACEEPIAYGTFSITADDINFSGTSADCGFNTSAPEGDPDRGTFFFDAIDDAGEVGTLIIVGSFPGYTSAPAAGSFDVPGDANISVSVTEEFITPIEGTMTATAVGTGLEFDFSGLSNLSGTLLCDLEE